MQKKLDKIHRLLSEADSIYESLSQEEKYKIAEFHNEPYLLPYCLRWGTIASFELIDEL